MSFPGLVPSEAEAAGALRIRELFADEDGDGETEPPPRRNGSDLVEQVDKLAVEWNVLASSLLPDFMAEEGIAVSCSFGKLLARVADMIDAEDTPALRVSLAKRAAADINGLIGDLRHVTDQCPAVVPQVSLLEEFLQHLRERIIDFLNAARKTMKS